jgi:P27 family predicted phage terminase small subunit
MLERAGVLTRADAIAVEMLCEAYGDYLGARDDIEAFGGNYYETRNQAGAVMHRAHPAVAVMRDADRRIRAWLAEFGMTPSARTRVNAAPEDGGTKDPAEKYF